MTPLTISQRHPGSVSASSADSRKIALQELRSSDLQAFLYYLGGELIHTVVHSPMENMFNGATLVMRSPMFADVLDTPVTKLAPCEHIDLAQHFFDRRSLSIY